MINAEIVLDSVFEGYRLTTMSVRMPRFLLPQFNTHRAFSRNAASNRALKFNQVRTSIILHPYIPEYYPVEDRGMVPKEELCAEDAKNAFDLILDLRDQALETTKKLAELGLHKSVTNRYLEPFMWTNVLVSATEWDNFFNLRIHGDAQAEMRLVAEAMRDALEASNPVERGIHLPYISDALDLTESFSELFEAGELGMFKDMLLFRVAISAACCARVSYFRNTAVMSEDVKKTFRLAKRLVEDVFHASPFEHTAFCCEDSKAWRNFKGWRQFRHLIEEWIEQWQ